MPKIIVLLFATCAIFTTSLAMDAPESHITSDSLRQKYNNLVEYTEKIHVKKNELFHYMIKYLRKTLQPFVNELQRASTTDQNQAPETNNPADVEFMWILTNNNGYMALRSFLTNTELLKFAAFSQRVYGKTNPSVCTCTLTQNSSEPYNPVLKDSQQVGDIVYPTLTIYKVLNMFINRVDSLRKILTSENMKKKLAVCIQHLDKTIDTILMTAE